MMTTKVYTALVTLLLASASSAFTTTKTAAFVRSTALEMQSSSVSRADFMGAMATAAAAAAACFTAASPANAAKYGSFGAGSPEVLDPAEAVVDSGVMKSDTVQNAIAKTKRYQAAVQSLLTAIDQQPQANLLPFIRKEFDFVQVRGDLNTLNLPLDEDSQRGTDRIIRIILQDITELESASKQQDGVPRSDRRLEAVRAKLTKLNQAFTDLLAFTSSA